MMYSFDEVGLIPAAKSTVKSRKDVNPFDENGKLPIFVSPMTCIINSNNFNTFNSKTYAIEPIYNLADTKSFEKRFEACKNHWTAFTVNEFEEHFINNKVEDVQYYILIDCAQGHMQRLYDLVYKAKHMYSHMTIMIGNIANPKAYLECCKAGVDFIRLGIGGGNSCTTSTQTGFHASMPWLICCITKYRQKGIPIKLSTGESAFVSIQTALKHNKILTETKIVADGGIDRVDKAMKALALGADYIMMGRQFASCKESCGTDIKGLEKPYKKYYGQSSNLGQIDRFGHIKSHSEGTSLLVEVTHSYDELVKDFEDVLRSAMSYANAKTLSEYIGKVKFEYQTEFEFKAYNK